MNTLFVLAVSLFLSATVHAAYAPADVTYTVTGASGDYTLDFTFHNNLINSQNAPGDFIFYKLGVALPGATVIDSPLKYNLDTPEPGYTNAWTYNNYANDGNPPGAIKQIVPLFAGASLDGFLLHSTDTQPPSIVPWYMIGSAQDDNGRWGFHSHGMYTGGVAPGMRGGQLRPMFEGIANGTWTGPLTVPTPVPLPPSVVLFGAGVIVLGAILYGRRFSVVL